MVLSSVAGERVRKANYVYGSSKAGIDGFAQGLGDALAGSGASVLIVRPGWVHSKMTEGMEPAPLRPPPKRSRRHGAGAARRADRVGPTGAAPLMATPASSRPVEAPAAAVPDVGVRGGQRDAETRMT